VSLKRTRLFVSLSVMVLSGCGTTRRFVDGPPLSVAGANKTVQQAAEELIDGNAPYTLALCDADPASKECKQGSTGIRANGVGGLFIPLVLNVSGVTVTKHGRSTEGWTIDASVKSKADAISPLCKTAHGQILLRDNATVTVQLRHFYCNWVVVGNVVVNADLSIDYIDPQQQSINGFYKISFHGTGNASGSGYYRAALLPSVAQSAP
jgi:hypothetical protein